MRQYNKLKFNTKKLKSYPSRLGHQSEANNLQAKKGFTLIETIIYMGLLAIILLVITNLLVTTSYFNLEQNARLEIQKNARFSMQKIIRDLSNAESVSTPAEGSSENTLVINTNNGQISYNISGERLIRNFDNINNNITDNQVTISDLNFQKIGNANTGQTIKISFKINYDGEVEGERDISQNFTTSYALK